MICEEKIGEYCRQAVMYKKYAQYRDCIECCIGCKNECDDRCDRAEEEKNE